MIDLICNLLGIENVFSPEISFVIGNLWLMFLVNQFYALLEKMFERVFKWMN